MESICSVKPVKFFNYNTSFKGNALGNCISNLRSAQAASTWLLSNLNPLFGFWNGRWRSNVGAKILERVVMAAEGTGEVPTAATPITITSTPTGITGTVRKFFVREFFKPQK